MKPVAIIVRLPPSAGAAVRRRNGTTLDVRLMPGGFFRVIALRQILSLQIRSAEHSYLLSCRGQGRAPRDGMTPGRASWSTGSRERCRPRTETDGEPVTQSNLSLRAPAQVAAVRRGQDGLDAHRFMRTDQVARRPGRPD